MKNCFLIAVCFLLIQCNKSPYTDLSGTAKLKGIVMIYDTLSGKPIITPAKNIKVFLKYAGATSGYIYATNADAQAQYTLNGIELNKNYTVYASTDTGMVKYYGERTYSANTFADGQSDTLKLYASTTQQNGIHLIVQDSSGGRLPYITTWVFTSPVLFAADASTGKDFDMVTNENGVANRYNISPITYYIRAKTQVGNVPLAAEEIVTVPEKGIETVILTLKSTLSNRNGIELKILDQYNTPVNNAVSYFYRSGTAFLADTVNYSNSIFKLTSNYAGLSTIYFIDSATYFFRTIKVFNKDTLSHMDTINVNKTSISTKTILLR